MSFIQRMFTIVAPKYDLFNKIASLTLDEYWREQAVNSCISRLEANPSLILDVGTGTGELALKLASKVDGGMVVGLDFCHEMIRMAKAKGGDAEFVVARAEDLPIRDNYFDAIITGFTMRHLNMQKALNEMCRVLKKDGQITIVEIGKFKFRQLRRFYYFYLRNILPLIGSILVRTRKPFLYLAKTVTSFIEEDQLTQVLREVGLREVHCHRLSAGIAFLYTGIK